MSSKKGVEITDDDLAEKKRRIARLQQGDITTNYNMKLDPLPQPNFMLDEPK